MGAGQGGFHPQKGCDINSPENFPQDTLQGVKHTDLRQKETKQEDCIFTVTVCYSCRYGVFTSKQDLKILHKYIKKYSSWLPPQGTLTAKGL